MAKHNIYIFNKEWFESIALCNPIEVFDNKLEKLYRDYYTIDYDLILLVTEENKKICLMIINKNMGRKILTI